MSVRESLREDELLEIVRSISELPEYAVVKGAPLKLYTTYRIGGPAELLIEPISEPVFAKLIHVFRASGISYKILGGGSNLLISDEGVREPVISTKRLNSIHLDWRGDDVLVIVGAGIKLSQLISLSIKEGFSGLEPLAGIPATIGGAVFNNAGAYGFEIGELVEAVKLVTPHDGEFWLNRDEIHFSYRGSSIKGTDAVLLRARLRLKVGKQEVVKRKVIEVLNRRKQTQPLEHPSCGSVFKNPKGRRAWELIDLAGLRGYRIGDAAFSEKHANFIVNLGRARASDVLELIELAQKRVKELTGVELEPEVEIWR